MDNEIHNIKDRQSDYKEIDKQSWRAELGIRSICIMYDDHSSDKNSMENISLLKENVHYRLFSLVHQYLIFLRELGNEESYLQSLHKQDPKLFFNVYPYGNPYYDKVESELSSVFDNIIIQLSSVFDYLSHLICYICKTDKSKTLYWTKLASSSRGEKNEFSNLEIKKTIINVDSQFVGRLYDYRSRLLHHKRDKHIFTTNVKLEDFTFNVKVIASEFSLKHFRVIREDFPIGEITLTFLSSWLIKRSFIEIEKLLDALREEILKYSNFHNNLRKPKNDKSFMFLSIDPKTKYTRPASESLWEQYKLMK